MPEHGRLTYIACEHIEKTESGGHIITVDCNVFELPNRHRLVVCDICYSIIVGKVAQSALNKAVSKLREMI